MNMTSERKKDVMRFRKKPVIIEAMRFSGCLNLYDSHSNFIAPDWLKEAIDKGIVGVYHDGDYIKIQTLEGDMIADKGDWIIQGVNGELYPCKDDIFQKTYERV